MALDALLQRCRAWKHRHLLGTKDLSRDDILLVLDVAEELAGLKDAAPLKGKRLFNFFVENSTRTKTSFALAARRLGADVVDFSPASSSLTKGESLKDTARTIESMGVALTVIRHSASGAPAFLSRLVQSAVINAGDGTNEHPTQALLDAATIRHKVGEVAGLKVAICGEIKHSRVARSNGKLLPRLGAEVRFAGPPELMPDWVSPMSVDEAIAGADVVMMLRVQRERLESELGDAPGEYLQRYGLTADRLAQAAPSALVMHPGPMNRGIEIDSAIADDAARSLITLQVEMGVATRMACLELVLDA
jgi:aspartate carbamoyltransferase catalytic subunit